MAVREAGNGGASHRRRRIAVALFLASIYAATPAHAKPRAGAGPEPRAWTVLSGARPYGIASDGHRVVAADGWNGALWGLATGGELAASPLAASLASPTGLALDPDGSLVVSDALRHRIVRLAPDGTVLAEWGGWGSAPGELRTPLGVAIGPTGDVYVADTGNHRIQRFSRAGALLTVIGSAGRGRGQLRDPAGIAVGRAGEILVADHGNDRIQAFGPDGVAREAWGTAAERPGLRGPLTVAVAPDAVYATDLDGSRVLAFAFDGERRAAIPLGAEHAGCLRSVASDPSGRLFVADADHGTIVEVAPEIAPAAPRPPSAFALTAVRPSPSLGVASFGCALPRRGRLVADVYGVNGGRVRALLDRELEAGGHVVRWDGADAAGTPVPSGLYFVRVRFDDGARSLERSLRVVRIR